MQAMLAGQKLIALIILCLASSLLALGLEKTSPFKTLEYKAYDGLFYLRAMMSDPADRPKTPVAIIGIDDRTTFEDQTFKIPQVLWNEFFSTVITGLSDGGAKAIGLDFLLPQTLFDDRVQHYSRAWLMAFLIAKRNNSPVVSGVIEIAGRQIKPEGRYLQLIGRKFICSFNLTPDDDNFIRRQRLLFPARDNPDDALVSFPRLLAEILQPDLKIPDGDVYIDYNHDPDPFPMYSFADVYYRAKAGDANYLKRNFKDRIVLIGDTSSLPRDRHNTPLFHLPSKGYKQTTPGVVIHANTIATILNGAYLTELSFTWRFGLYFILTLILCSVTLFGREWSMWFWTPIMVLVYGATSVVLFNHYVILPLVGGILALLLNQVGAFSYRHWIVDREKRKLRTIFQRYQSPRVVQRLLDTRDEDILLGESKRLCLMFTDIRSFTAYSEKKEPAEVVSRLNEYFEAMSSVIVSEGGVVDKFLGDGIMAFYGAFDMDTPPSLAGARAGLKMLDELERLNQRWSAKGEETFRIGIGIHTGEVKIGNIGSEKKMEYTVIGDAVNLASRLQDKTKLLGEEIVISEDVYKDLGDRAIVKDRGLEDIKGRSRTRVYGLRGLRGES